MVSGCEVPSLSHLKTTQFDFAIAFRDGRVVPRTVVAWLARRLFSSRWLASGPRAVLKVPDAMAIATYGESIGIAEDLVYYYKQQEKLGAMSENHSFIWCEVLLFWKFSCCLSGRLYASWCRREEWQG